MAKKDKAIKDRRTKEADDMQERADQLGAAEVWQKKRVMKAPVSELTANYNILVGAGIAVPLSNRIVYSRRVSMELHRADDVNLWHTQTWAFDTAVPPSAWEMPTPKWSALIQELAAGEKYTDLLDGETFGQTWQQCVLNDEFLAAMDEETKHRQLFQMVTLILTAAADATRDEVTIPDCIAVEYSEIVQVLKGFAALLSPKPGLFSSTPADVAFIRDVGTAGTISDTTIKNKKSIVKRLQRKPFSTLVDNYRKSEAVLLEYGPVMAEIESQTLELKAADFEDEEAGAEILKKFVVGIAQWRKDLRKGATDDVEKVVLELLQHKIAKLSKELETSSEVSRRLRALRALEKFPIILKLFESKNGVDTLQKAMNLRDTWAAKDQLLAMEELATSATFHVVEEAIGCREWYKGRSHRVASCIVRPKFTKVDWHATGRSPLPLRLVEVLGNKYDFRDVLFFSKLRTFTKIQGPGKWVGMARVSLFWNLFAGL